jgi:hypothetical protein
MPFIPNEEWTKALKRIDVLEQRQKTIFHNLNFFQGQPNIQGYPGKRLDLNDQLNVILFKKDFQDKIDKLQKQITALS